MILFFSVLIVLALVSGALGIRAKNTVHSVVFLILVFCNTSGLLVLLGLDFFAMFFLVVYVGAVFILFVVMMLHIRIEEIHENVLRYLPIGGFIGLIFVFYIFKPFFRKAVSCLTMLTHLRTLPQKVGFGSLSLWSTSVPVPRFLVKPRVFDPKKIYIFFDFSSRPTGEDTRPDRGEARSARPAGEARRLHLPEAGTGNQAYERPVLQPS